MKQHIVFDTEILGLRRPVFLVCAKIIETGERFTFWHDKRGHTAKLEKMLANKNYTWISFNGTNFDAPLVAAAIMGHDEEDLKEIATQIIRDELRSWRTYKQFNIDFLDYDHIDLIETAPGVMTSLKTYAGRMAFPNMVDMPYHHDEEIDTPAKRKVVQDYCHNDCDVTEALFKRLATEIELREVMGAEYGQDFRSKSDAQIAEAILKKQVGINNQDKQVPMYVEYTAPTFIKTRSKALKDLITAFENECFSINRGNGSPVEAEWMKEPIKVGQGLYKVGLGGLHSQHDKKLHLEASDKMMLSDFDVASYYPNIMMKAGLIPRLGGNKGHLFLDEYKTIYDRRMEAKRSGNKKVANTLKIVLNGTFGKLGSIYCSFYSPDLLIAVTITGQLNLLCLIDELEKLTDVTVQSANTDGVLVAYPPAQRQAVLDVFARNAKRTGFEYEETPYHTMAMKDVNNYIAITAESDAAIISKTGVFITRSEGGKAKTKGLYADSGLMKNPTMQVCSDAVVEYLRTGCDVSEFVHTCYKPEDFMAIRNVKGGGVQHKKVEMVDDWVCVNDLNSAKTEWVRQDWIDTGRYGSKDRTVAYGSNGVVMNITTPGCASIKRKSRPAPVEVFSGGTSFGRVARWYMTTQEMPPISYVGSGNKVPKTEGARVCLSLPDKLPADLNLDWYVNEAYQILEDIGVRL